MTPLVKTWRGGNVEGVHRGTIAVVNERGTLLASVGDPEVHTYARSAIKGIQAIPVIESGAAEKYDLDDAELAICCASHTSAEYHLEAVASILRKIGLEQRYLKCGAHIPGDREVRKRVLCSDSEFEPIFNNCSGKHAGMLAACLANDWPLDNYLDLDHPLQQRILELVAEYSGVDAGDIQTATDGCSLPTFWLPIRAIARMAARFAFRGSSEFSEAPTPERRLISALAAHPEMIQCKGGFDSEAIAAFPGRCYAKRGAMGVIMIGIARDDGAIGMALKIEDGEGDVVPIAATHLLGELGLLDDHAAETLRSFARTDLKNWNGILVGETRAEFQLEVSK